MLRCISLDKTHCHFWSLSGCFCISCNEAVSQFYIDRKCNMKLQHNFLFSVFINVFILYVFSHEVEVDNLYTYTHTHIHTYIHTYVCSAFGSSFLGKDTSSETVMTWMDASIP